MKCRTATDILRVAKVDVDEEFPFIEIPQANLPKNGEAAPKLKIAVKDGEEYFDTSTGKMMSFESESDAEVESNEFAAAASAISADAIISDDVAEEDIIPDEPAESKPAPAVIESPAFAKPAAPVPKPAKQETAPQTEEHSSVDEIVLPAKRHKVIIPGKSNAAPAQTIKPTYITPPVVKSVSELVSDSDDDDNYDDEIMTADVVAEPKTVPVSRTVTAQNVNAPVTAPVKAAAPSVPKSKKPYKKTTKGLTSLIGDEGVSTDTSDITLTEDADEEENLYTDTLIKMLRANRSNNQLMKDVDTKHIFNNGDSLGQAETPELAMDAINMKKLDKSLLSSPFESTQQKTKGMNPKDAMAEKYRNININDMLNPTMGNKLNGEFKPDAIEEFKKQKQKQKSFQKGLWKFVGLITLLVLIMLFLFYFGVL